MSKARELANLGNAYSDGALSNRNKIINGAMTIDQRNGGAAVSISTGANNYTIDRWSASASGGGVFNAQRSTSSPSGFINSFGLTVTTNDTSIAATDYYIVEQQIEGFNCADLNWGSSDAASVTLSFWVKSSLSGSASGRLCNSALNRSYIFKYDINAVDTWEHKTVTISGDTSGTWLTDSGRGLSVTFNLASGSSLTSATTESWISGNIHGDANQTVNFIGTNGATFYITGVQLEVGDTATPFEHRSYGQELAKCQRYYWKDTGIRIQAIAQGSVYDGYVQVFLPVPMRAAPTATSLTGGSTFALNISGSPGVGINTGTVTSTWTTHIEYLTQANGVNAVGNIGYANGTATASAEL